jgi:hypothetical protein
MSDLIPFKNNDGLELVVDTNTGETFASISAVARMTDKDKSLISRYVNGGLKTVARMELKTAELQTATGLKTVVLLNEHQIMEVIYKYNPELLKNITWLGTRAYLHKLAGYKHESTPVAPKTALELAKEQVKLLEQIELKDAAIALLEEDNKRQSELIDELYDHSSIVRVSKHNGVTPDNFSWGLLKAASRKLGKEIKKSECPVFGTRNLYSHDAWRFVYPDVKLPEITTIVSNPSGNEFN